jgi:hypothetical protein
MKTGGLFTTHQVVIPCKLGQEIPFVFFGDVHRDSPNHADGKWQEDLAYFRSLKDAYCELRLRGTTILRMVV